MTMNNRLSSLRLRSGTQTNEPFDCAQGRSSKPFDSAQGPPKNLPRSFARPEPGSAIGINLPDCLHFYKIAGRIKCQCILGIVGVYYHYISLHYSIDCYRKCFLENIIGISCIQIRKDCNGQCALSNAHAI